MDNPLHMKLSTVDKLSFLGTEIEMEIGNMCMQKSLHLCTEETFDRLKHNAERASSPEVEYVALLFREYVRCVETVSDTEWVSDRGASLEIRRPRFPAFLLRLTHFLEQSYPRPIAGLAATRTALFWLRLILVTIGSVSLILLCESNLLQQTSITERNLKNSCALAIFSPVFRISTAPFVVLLSSTILVLVVNTTMCVYYLLPVDDTGAKTLGLSCYCRPTARWRPAWNAITATMEKCQQNAKCCELIVDSLVFLFVLSSCIQGFTALSGLVEVTWHFPMGGAEEGESVPALVSTYTLGTFLVTFRSCLDRASILNESHVALVQGCMAMLVMIGIVQLFSLRIEWKSVLDEHRYRAVQSAESLSPGSCSSGGNEIGSDNEYESHAMVPIRPSECIHGSPMGAHSMYKWAAGSDVKSDNYSIHPGTLDQGSDDGRDVMVSSAQFPHLSGDLECDSMLSNCGSDSVATISGESDGAPSTLYDIYALSPIFQGKTVNSSSSGRDRGLQRDYCYPNSDGYQSVPHVSPSLRGKYRDKSKCDEGTDSISHSV